MDFKLQMGRLLAIFGIHLSNCFLCGLLLCVLPLVICFMFGVVWVLGFFVISICTELLCFGRGIFLNFYFFLEYIYTVDIQKRQVIH